MTREQFLSLFYSRGTLAQAGAQLGLTDEEMGAALLEAAYNKEDRLRHEAQARTFACFKPPESEKIWCCQCERLVKKAEAVRCWSKFCKANAT